MTIERFMASSYITVATATIVITILMTVIMHTECGSSVDNNDSLFLFTRGGAVQTCGTK